MTLAKYLAVFCLVPGSFLAVALLFFALDLLARAGLAAVLECVPTLATPFRRARRWL